MNPMRAEMPLFSIASLLEQIILDFCSVILIRTKLLIKVGKHAPEKSILRFRLREALVRPVFIRNPENRHRGHAAQKIYGQGH